MAKTKATTPSKPTTTKLDITFKKAFLGDQKIQSYGSSALSVFALSLYLGISDIGDFAAEAIPVTSTDKKIDACYFDRDAERVIVAQGYTATTWNKREAPANKASDLTAAATWLFNSQDQPLPPWLEAKAREINQAIRDGQIKRVEIFLVHNCFESPNVENELKGVARTTQAILLAQGNTNVQVAHHEFGLHKIESLYRARDYDILINKLIKIPCNGVLKETGPNWNAVLVSVTGDWIRQLHEKYKDDLFHANFRDFMGVTAHRGNINSGIQTTAKNEPANFWIYNNGVTAITHEIKSATKKAVRIRGISIVNGAQTTGALGELSGVNLTETKIPLRVVQCDKDLVANVILYNNTQNEMKAFDRRSNDQVQKRLHEDFKAYNIAYVHRRASARNPPTSIYAKNIGRWLCAFHGDLQTAARNADDIFFVEEIYDRVFRGIISAEHIYLVHTLAGAVDRLKTDFKKKVDDKVATDLEVAQEDVLKYSLSKLFIIYVVGRSAEEIFQQRIPDLIGCKFLPASITPEAGRATAAWVSVLSSILPHIPAIITNLNSTAYDVTRSPQLTDQVAIQLKGMLAGFKDSFRPQFSDLKKKITV